MKVFRHIVFLTIIFLFSISVYAQLSFNKIAISISPLSDDVEIKVAELLKDRLMELGHTEVRLEHRLTFPGENELLIFLGRPDHSINILNQFEELRIPELTELAPGPEGFLLRWIGENRLVAAGIDDRGCLYAVGELLRQVRSDKESVLFPEKLNIRTAPAFEIRGTQYGQSHIAKRLAHVRDWTDKETQRVIIDYALAGANIFATIPGPMFDFIKSYKKKKKGGFGANTAGTSVPKEWNASESIGRTGYVCLSVPEARKFMLNKCDQYFKNSPSFDIISFHGGDGGGCECDRCNPYGLTFITLIEEMAGIIHRYHPETRIMFTNQKFDNDDDNAIFKYLREKPRKWLWSWGYGPGSDATTWQPGHRQTHRMDLFRYPGFGPYRLYPKEILHQLPPWHSIVYYSEITHWKYAQHAYIQMYPRADRNGDLPPHWSHEIYERRPDQYLTMVYNRLTFYAWPRYYHRVFNDLMPYSIGDITHSSGHHDHFNQWMWQRLLWSPRMSVEDVVKEYCVTWFGKEAAPYMAKAIFQLEENMNEIPGEPLLEKKGILNYYNLVKKAGEEMPEQIMKNNWLWRMYMQKGALDRYVQLSVKQQIQLQNDVQIIVSLAIRNGITKEDVKHALTLLNSSVKESVEMKSLRDESRRLGEESNAIFGVRSDGYFNLNHDFIGLGWLKRQLNRALDAPKSKRAEILSMITDYEDPGEGGMYDNLGTANIAPNVVFGYPYDHGQPYVSEMLLEGNRPCQRSMHFTQDEKQGVTLQYRNLDPEAKYRIRFTLVRPWYQERYAMRMNQKSESIYADEILIADNVELPLQMSDFYTFKIPKKVTKDGKLEIRFEKAPDVANGDRVSVEQWRNSGGWGTIVSEVWLMKE